MSRDTIGERSDDLVAQPGRCEAGFLHIPRPRHMHPPPPVDVYFQALEGWHFAPHRQHGTSTVNIARELTSIQSQDGPFLPKLGYACGEGLRVECELAHLLGFEAGCNQGGIQTPGAG